MIVLPHEPFEVVFSIFNHEYLGYLIEGYVAQLNAKGEVSYKTQNISAKNMEDFEHGMDQTDKELIELTDSIQQEVILKKFNPKKLSSEDFFSRIFDPEKEDKLVKEAIQTYIDNRKRQIFERIKSKKLFVMGNDGIPTWKALTIVQEPAKAYFHFERLEDHTVYYPIIKCGEEKLKFQFKNAVIINDMPAAMLLESKVYLFDQYADGKKIRPFLNKPNIIIPKKIEETYYHKFIVPLVAGFNVFASGFEIIKSKAEAKPKILLEPMMNANQTMDLFQENVGHSNDNFKVSLMFNYGEFDFFYDVFGSPDYVKLEKKDDSWVFYKVRKNIGFEKECIAKLLDKDLNFKNGSILKPKYEMFEWIMENAVWLEFHGIEIVQQDNSNHSYFLGKATMNVTLEEKNDWFDINAIIYFGEFKIPFKDLKKYILSNIKEFTLPNGQKAVIPSAWFTQYSDLFFNSIDTEEGVRIPLIHLGYVYQLAEDGLANTITSRRLENLKDFEKIEEVELPQYFTGSLRPYQKAAYDWLHFLKSYRLGGCLADDMGLGKTVTTLSFLSKLYEEDAQRPTLLVMPTSLIYNWQKEARKFCPKLRALVHFGMYRDKVADRFKNYQLIITTYGIMRSDIEFLKQYEFEYVILDESQNIKNPQSSTFKSVMQLNSKGKLILTGTPLENTTVDLWSQMNFVNPGLLGTESDFKNKFTSQIDKKRVEEVTHKLAAKIKPFMLRRQKSQVAKDLPEKIETISYCVMTEEQERLYEETRSYIRNTLLSSETKNNILIIQGLTKLRQIANHPFMVDEKYEGGSGKDTDVIHKLKEIVEKGYKTLVFSQFVKHLHIVEERLKQEGINYLYLDGTTKNRMDLVDKFQSEAEPKIFLISLKAGGVGLNLTAAEYVFILDPWWNPASEAQAVDRAHRIGQSKTVFSYKFITQNTIEEKILDLQNRKKELFDSIISTEENFTKSLNQDDLLALLA
ncbi:MAG: DEAD/DEAH box helicase [Leadbetterella sp.]